MRIHTENDEDDDEEEEDDRLYSIHVCDRTTSTNVYVCMPLSLFMNMDIVNHWAIEVREFI